tara:strand:+ start:47574 stop:49889 length:2316 start_codon:yes stop_codon:yes gene_type:complete
MINTVSQSETAVRRSAARQGAAGQSQVAFDPWILWVTFRQCWAWAIPVGVVFAAAAAFFVFKSFVPKYESTHILEANQDYVVFKGVIPPSNDLAKTEKQLILNPLVLDPVLSEPGVRQAPSLSDPRTAEQNLQANLEVGNAGTKSLLTVSYRDSDPEAAALVCNSIVDSYLRVRDRFDQARVSSLEHWLTPEIQRWEQEVQSHQQHVQRLSERVHGYDPGQRLAALENDNAFSLMGHLRSQITDLKVEKSLLEAKIAMAQSDTPLPVPELPDLSDLPVIPLKIREPLEAEIDAFVENDPEVLEAKGILMSRKRLIMQMEDNDLVRINREHYNELQKKRDEQEKLVEVAKTEARARASEELRKLAEADLKKRQERADQDRELAMQEMATKRSLTIAQRKQDQLQAVRDEQRKLQELIRREGLLEQQYAQEKSRLEEFGGDTAELQFAQAEMGVANSVLTKLRDRIAAIRTERRRDGAVRTLAAAVPAKVPVETMPIKKMAMASTGAFMVPFLIGLLWELRIKRVTNAANVESRTRARVVGEVAKFPTGVRTKRSRRVFEESIDSLRCNLFLSADCAGARSLAIASSMSGEGKSSVASQLAVSISRASGKKVLLIDADLRSPDQHEIFGLEMGPGLCKVLEGEAQLSDAIDKSLGDYVHLLPAGRLSRSPHRLVSISAMRDIVDRALEDYEYVIIDTAPVLSAGETLSVTAAVDVTLLCVMRDVSREDCISRTTKRLEASGAHVAGTVFSGVPSREYAYKYGDYEYVAAGAEA